MCTGNLKKLRRAEGGAKTFGVFRVKNHDFTPKNLIFSNCGGRREHYFPESAPGVNTIESKKEFMGYYAGLICIVNYVHSYVQQVCNVHHFDQIIYLVIHWFDETIFCFHSI